MNRPHPHPHPVFARKLIAAGLALGALSLATSAQAALSLVDDVVFGSQAVLHDSVTGLEWLRLDFSYGKTYSYVAGQLGTGGEFAGWSIPSTDFLLDWLGTPNGLVQGDASVAAVAAAAALRDQICFTDGQCKVLSSSHYVARGLVSDVAAGVGFAAQDAFTAGIELADANGPVRVDFRYSGFAPVASVNEAVWLWRGVTPPIPEPGSLALLLAGGLVVAAIARRRNALVG